MTHTVTVSNGMHAYPARLADRAFQFTDDRSETYRVEIFDGDPYEDEIDPVTFGPYRLLDAVMYAEHAASAPTALDARQRLAKIERSDLNAICPNDWSGLLPA